MAGGKDVEEGLDEAQAEFESKFLSHKQSLPLECQV
jgi:hypothetical protein